VGEETVLLDFDRGVYYGLDPVGTRMLELLASGRSREATIDALMDEYKVDRATLAADLEKLLRELAAHGLVTIA
jgi:hypothetical protein